MSRVHKCRIQGLAGRCCRSSSDRTRSAVGLGDLGSYSLTIWVAAAGLVLRLKRFTQATTWADIATLEVSCGSFLFHQKAPKLRACIRW